MPQAILRRLFASLLVLAALAVASGCGDEAGPGPDSGSEVTTGLTPDRSEQKDETRARKLAARQEARATARRERAAARLAARKERAAKRRNARQLRAEAGRDRIRARHLARQGGDVNCGDFASQAEAQRYLLAGDPFRLDGDGDGVACNSLPCPCSPAAGGDPGPGGSRATPPRSFRGTVVSVADGDTLDVTTPSGSVETVRIIGIDTPEVYGGKECGGPAASAAMKRMADGQQVRVVADPTQDRRDRYGRLLAYIDRGSQDLGLTMVKRGLASAYPYDGPFQRYPKYEQADRQARNEGRGSWRHCDISPG